MGFAQPAAQSEVSCSNVAFVFLLCVAFHTIFLFVFGEFLLGGGIPRAFRDRTNETRRPQGAQVRFFIVFSSILGSISEGIFKHLTLCPRPFSECFFGSLQTRVCKDFGFVFESFSDSFSVCFWEQAKTRFS